ncbi:MAG: MFS transporter, partial [Acidimicrobiia bacterium]
QVMVWGALLVTAASVGAALAPNYPVLLATRVGEGIGTAAFATAAMQLIVVTTPKDRLGRTMALYQTGLIAGIGVGPLIGGYAAQLGDFTTPFWIYAGLELLVAALARFLVEGAAPGGRTFGEGYRAAGRLLRSPAFLGLLFVSFSLFIMRAGARITLIPLYAGEELGLSESEIGGVLAVSALVNLVIVNPGGWLVDRLGRRPVLITGLVLTGIATALYGEMTTFASLLWLSIAFGGAAALASIPPPTLAGDLAPPGAEGASVGLYRTAGDLGFVIGPLLLGAVAENGAFETGFFLSGGLLLVAALVAVGIGETRRRREPAVPVEAP